MIFFRLFFRFAILFRLSIFGLFFVFFLFLFGSGLFGLLGLFGFLALFVIFDEGFVNLIGDFVLLFLGEFRPFDKRRILGFVFRGNFNSVKSVVDYSSFFACLFEKSLTKNFFFFDLQPSSRSKFFVKVLKQKLKQRLKRKKKLFSKKHAKKLE